MGRGGHSDHFLTLECGSPPDLNSRVQTVNCRSLARGGGCCGLAPRVWLGARSCRLWSLCTACVKSRGDIVFNPQLIFIVNDLEISYWQTVLSFLRFLHINITCQGHAHSIQLCTHHVHIHSLSLLLLYDCFSLSPSVSSSFFYLCYHPIFLAIHLSLLS